MRPDENVPDQETTWIQSSKATLQEEEIQSKEKKEAQKATVGSARGKVCAALFPSSCK